MKVKKGDKVKILSGKDRGKTGTIKMVFRKTAKVIVEGVNFVTTYEKKKSEEKKGGLIKVEGPISVSKVQLLDSNGKPGRVGFKFEKDKKVRISTRTKEVI